MFPLSSLKKKKYINAKVEKNYSHNNPKEVPRKNTYSNSVLFEVKDNVFIPDVNPKVHILKQQ